MSEKLDRIGADRDRAKEKRDQWDARYKELCQKYIQQENTRRSMRWCGRRTDPGPACGGS